ncbi:hypothetical protein [Hymenobacter psychrotolerans]|uniref:hypothetical protein n=1 Tax=Hymenobacter psychrotolerans TaxID=344998 RepID=UPI001114D7D9|nr:hypothetical protein [Hymenobacter psychrotolerans]
MAKKNRLSPKVAELDEGTRIHLPANAIQVIGYSDKGNNAVAHPSLRYYQSSHECLSDWPAGNLKAFSSFIERVREQTWQQIYQSGGKGQNKAGLGYTQHKDKSVLPNKGLVAGLGPDVNLMLDMFELRVTQRARVHCFRQAHFMFIVWLDGKHEVYEE